MRDKCCKGKIRSEGRKPKIQLNGQILFHLKEVLCEKIGHQSKEKSSEKTSKLELTRFKQELKQ